MIIIWNLFIVRARAAAVTFACYFRGPRSLLSRERDMFRHQTAVIAIKFYARFLQIMRQVTSFQETILYWVTIPTISLVDAIIICTVHVWLFNPMRDLIQMKP